MTTYLALKHLHVTCVVTSLTLFVLRGAWMLAGSSRLRDRWVRVVPHFVDAVLLASAVGMVVILQQYPFVHGWLTAKVLALVAYIGLGTVALKRGRTLRLRAAALAGALGVAGYIVAVAITHDPLPWRFG